MRRSIKVQLDYDAIKEAAYIGVDRQIDNLRNHRRPAYGSGRKNDWQKAIEGCLGEKAVSEAFGIYWDGNVGNLTAADVGNIDVRTTSLHNGSLIIHHRDHDNRPFVLATGINGEYYLRGWLKGGDGKKEEYWKKTDRPAFFVPQSVLEAFGDEEDPFPGIELIPF